VTFASFHCVGNLQNDNFAKCELINDFFSEQSNLDDSNSTVPEPIDPLYDKLTQLHITETDIEDVLQLLDTTKATGPDLINPRLVREGASILKLPLCLYVYKYIFHYLAQDTN
jgi:hypothetical protein